MIETKGPPAVIDVGATVIKEVEEEAASPVEPMIARNRKDISRDLSGRRPEKLIDSTQRTVLCTTFK